MRRFFRRIGMSALVGTVALSAQPKVYAADPLTVEQRQRIESLVEQAIEQRRAGELDKAIESMKAALAIHTSHDLLYSLGRLYEDASKWDLARSHYELCLSDTAPDDIRQRARDGLARLEKVGERGRLELVISPASATLEIDGELWPLDAKGATSLTAGPHRLRVSHPGFQSHTQNVDVVGGQSVRVVVNLAKDPVIRTVEVPTIIEKPRRVDYGAWPWVALGSGLVVGGIGGYFFYKGTDYWATEVEGQEFESVEAYEDAKAIGSRDRNVGIGLMAAGGALAATGVVLLLLSDDGEVSTSWSLEPVVTPQSLGVSLGTGF